MCLVEVQGLSMVGWHTGDRISLALAVHMKYFQGKENQMTSQIETNVIEELFMWAFTLLQS